SGQFRRRGESEFLSRAQQPEEAVVMSHLSPAEFVDAVEGRLPSPRAAHLESCVRCRDGAESVGSALRAAHDDDLPEPSPLYWQHLSARIRDRVAGERIAPAWRAAPWPQAFAVRALVPV